MRALSSIPVLFAVALAGTACDNSPVGPGGGPQNPAVLLVVAPSAATIRGGATLQLNLRAQDENGRTTPPTHVAWSTSNPQVASVSADGVVIGRAAGASQITANWNGVRGVSTITVIADGPAKCPPQGGGAELSLKSICLAK